MKSRFILYRRQRGGMFYIEDTHTRKQESLGTKIRAEAAALLNARNESIRQPQLNLQIAKAYLAGTDSGVSTRTWRDAFNAIIDNKTASTKERWQRGARQKAFDLIHHLIIVETQAEHLFACLKAGTVSTNILLRELHNFCISMNWLAWPIIPKRLWPKIEYGPKRAITTDEHRMIVERERNLELRALYDLCWHLGGSQTDIANLAAENIDWSDRVIAYARRKTGTPAFIHFGPAVEAILRSLPGHGLLLPRVALMQAKHRAKEFKRRCVGLGIMGVSLHSYRYAWAERAKSCG
jgi:integrase